VVYCGAKAFTVTDGEGIICRHLPTCTFDDQDIARSWTSLQICAWMRGNIGSSFMARSGDWCLMKRASATAGDSIEHHIPSLPRHPVSQNRPCGNRLCPHRFAPNRPAEDLPKEILAAIV